MIRTFTLAAAAAVLSAGVALADDPIDTFADEATVGVTAAAQEILAKEAMSDDDFMGNRLNGANTGASVSTKSPSISGLEQAYKNAVADDNRALAAHLAKQLGI